MLVRILGERGKLRAHDYGIAAGSSHVVCAMFSLEPGVLLYCLDTENLLHVEAELFDVVDSRLSRWWHFSHEYQNDAPDGCNSFYWGYPEFVLQEQHRQALFDGQPNAVAIYRRYVERLTLEFSLPFIDGAAKQIEDGWVICSDCGDAWQPEDDTLEMLRCPKCSRLQHRP